MFLGLQYQAPSDPPVMYTSSTPPGHIAWFEKKSKFREAAGGLFVSRFLNQGCLLERMA